MGAGGRGTPTPRRSRDNGASWDLSRCDLQSMLSIASVKGLQQMTKGTLLGFRACVLRGAAVSSRPMM